MPGDRRAALTALAALAAQVERDVGGARDGVRVDTLASAIRELAGAP